MLAEIFMVRLEALMRERTRNPKPTPAQNQRFVPFRLPRK